MLIASGNVGVLQLVIILVVSWRSFALSQRDIKRNERLRGALENTQTISLTLAEAARFCGFAESSILFVRLFHKAVRFLYVAAANTLEREVLRLPTFHPEL
jgi:hypothetical protein